MKAKVKATGEIVEARRICQSSQGPIWEAEGSDYYEYELDFDVQEPTKHQYTPDYWTRLEHQYAGMAMQGTLMNEKMTLDLHQAFGKNESMDVIISEFVADIAHTLIQKLKEKEERK